MEETENVCLIPLTQGLFAKVDASMFEELNKFKWCAAKMGQRVYAIRRGRGLES
jgi:hypothetical protein